MFSFCKKILFFLVFWAAPIAPVFSADVKCELPLVNKILSKSNPSATDFLFQDPPTSPTKVPQVFLISSRDTPDKILGVLKIFINTLDFEQEIKSIEFWKHLKFHQFGRTVQILSTESNLIFMEHAGTEDVEAKIMRLWDRQDLPDTEKKDFLIDSAQILGRFLAEIHQIKKATIDSPAEDKIVRPFIDYEANKLMSFTTALSTQNRLLSELRISAQNIEKLNLFFNKSSGDYKKIGARTRALYHGDAHPGNFSILGTGHVITFDLQSSLWSLDPTLEFSIADPMADLGKMSMGFLVTGMNANLPMAWLEAARNALKASYFEHEAAIQNKNFSTPQETPVISEKLWLSQNTAIEFYENRMAALVLASKKKMTDDTRRKLIDYLVRQEE